MRKTVIRALAFVSLLTMIPISAYARSYTNIANVRGISYNPEPFTGEIGVFVSTGTTGTTARSTTTVTNKDTQTRYLHVRTDRYNYNDLRVDDSANSTGTVDPGYVRIASIPRASGSYVYDYIHTGTARRGITVQDYLVDSYSYKAKQYY